MYTLKELKIAESFSIRHKKHRLGMNTEVKRIVTQWGKNKIDFSDLSVRVQVHQHICHELSIDLSYPEFGAGFSIEYTKKHGVRYSKGSIGMFGVEQYPRQRDILLLMAKLLENNDKLEDAFSSVLPNYVKTEISLEEERNNIDNTFPGLLSAYFESDMYKCRVNSKQKK